MAALADLRPVVENEASGLATIRPELKKTHFILAQRARWAIGNIERESSFEIGVGGASATVASKGSFWFDPVSLDLIRLDVHGEALPYSLRLEETSIRTFYARAHIGESDALLPKRSELTMTHFSG